MPEKNRQPSEALELRISNKYLAGRKDKSMVTESTAACLYYECGSGIHTKASCWRSYLTLSKRNVQFAYNSPKAISDGILGANEEKMSSIPRKI